MRSQLVTVCHLFAIVSGTSEAVFNLINGTEGLMIPVSSGYPTYIEFRSPLTIVGSPELELIEADGHIVEVPLSGPVPIELTFAHVNRMSISPRSAFATRFRNAMIISPFEDHSTFQLMAGMTNPETHCYDGVIGYADMSEDAIKFRVDVSLIPASGRTLVTRGTNQFDITGVEFGISTDRLEDMIPFQIYLAFVGEVAYIAGVSNRAALDDMDWSPFVHLLPSIRYTVYRSNDSDEVVARIVMDPHDLITLLPLGWNVALQTTLNHDQYSLGINTLKHVGVFLDYENSRIGFFEPI